MIYHVIYRKRNGKTEVGRVNASSRSSALANAAIQFNVPRRNVTSAVACPSPRSTN